MPAFTLACFTTPNDSVSLLFDRPVVRVECGNHVPVNACVSKITGGGAFGR